MTKIITCIASILLLTYTPISTIPAYSTDKSPHISPKEKTRTINTIAGQIFLISLDCQTSTGYIWYITEPITEDFVQLVSKSMIPYRFPGGRGQTIFRFQALKAGYETIKFQYSRPWSWDVAQQYTYTIIIHEKSRYTKPTQHTPPFALPTWQQE